MKINHGYKIDALSIKDDSTSEGRGTTSSKNLYQWLIYAFILVFQR
jgi:hypothetical protein